MCQEKWDKFRCGHEFAASEELSAVWACERAHKLNVYCGLEDGTYARFMLEKLSPCEDCQAMQAHTDRMKEDMEAHLNWVKKRGLEKQKQIRQKEYPDDRGYGF